MRLGLTNPNLFSNSESIRNQFSKTDSPVKQVKDSGGIYGTNLYRRSGCDRGRYDEE